MTDKMTYRVKRRRRAVLHSIREPDLRAVAATADKLGMDPTKVAAVWMLMVDHLISGEGKGMKTDFIDLKDNLVKLSSEDGVYFNRNGYDAQLIVVGHGPSEMTADEIVEQFSAFIGMQAMPVSSQDMGIGYIGSDMSIRRAREMYSRGFAMIMVRLSPY